MAVAVAGRDARHHLGVIGLIEIMVAMTRPAEIAAEH
jgi:hypothetical protein